MYNSADVQYNVPKAELQGTKIGHFSAICKIKSTQKSTKLFNFYLFFYFSIHYNDIVILVHALTKNRYSY